MTINIAHRGNISGKTNRENQQEYLLHAIESGYDVEFDLWRINESLFLGHDEPQYPVKEDFLLEVGHAAWIHCKNLDALYFLNTTFPHLNYFWHQDDSYTLTSQGYIWTYPGNAVTDKSVIVDLSGKEKYDDVYAISSDNFNL